MHDVIRMASQARHDLAVFDEHSTRRLYLGPGPPSRVTGSTPHAANEAVLLGQ